MKTARALRVIVWFNLLMCVSAALADGGFFIRRAPYKYADVFQPTQKVYIRWDGSQERLLIQTKYEGPAEEMVWLIPIPSQATVERADGSVFNDLSKETYDPAIDMTHFAGLDTSHYASISGGVGMGRSTTTPVEWHERIGDYDVALLRPVGGEDVIQWLNSNDFAIPDGIDPLLESYIQDGWWMVAARIHPDALTSITREKLAQGTLHPLEMTFATSACVYPLRLTRIAAGPVEELIYIEGPDHYVPVTLAGGPWEIAIFGGPVRTVPQNYYLCDIERAVEIREGRTKTKVMRNLTKLRRVFEPNEMTEDLVFGKLDYADWLTSGDPLRIAQAATQYGRHRDPNGIDYLLAVLSPEALDQVKPAPNDYAPWSLPSGKILHSAALLGWSFEVYDRYVQVGPSTARIGCGHMQSCIWALGEIAVEHRLSDAAVDLLLDCARHDNQLIRMEAWMALTKARQEGLGTILMDQLVEILRGGLVPPIMLLYDLQITTAPMDIAADWISTLGTSQQKDAFVEMLEELVAKTPADTNYFINDVQRRAPASLYWSTWILWRAACAQDTRLLPAMEALHTPCAEGQTDCVPALLLHAEAACGSHQANTTILGQILGDEIRILQEGGAGTGNYTALRTAASSLRDRILYERGLRYVYYPMPSDVADGILRSALVTEGISDWYRLYLLARVKKPQASEYEALMRIWDEQDESKRLLTVDVLYVWGDVQTLLDIYEEAEFSKVKSEIAWALLVLEVPEATSIIEEHVRDVWNPEWLLLEYPFVHRPQSSWAPIRRGEFRQYLPEWLPPEIERNEQALWNYFHPETEVFDGERLASLQRLTADRAIHAGMRFDLLGQDYGGTGWGLPSLEQAARDILSADSLPATVGKIAADMMRVGDGHFIVELCREPISDQLRRDILDGLLQGAASLEPLAAELLSDVWPQRYMETAGNCPLFGPPYDLWAQTGSAEYSRKKDTLLNTLVLDDSLPAGYRVFLLIHWADALWWVSPEFAEALLEEEMPEYLKEGLRLRLANWQFN